MSWTLDRARKVWGCSKFFDLDGTTINNFAEYGQPYTPYEHPGFDADFEPDFSNVIIEMPQQQVMTHGYGKNITATDFSIVERFLDSASPLPLGTYSFDDLLSLKYAKNKSERWISTNLYGWGRWGITSGDLDFADAAYVHGTVSLALMSSTRFINQPAFRQVDAEIGAGDDNWDFDSSTIPLAVEAGVATIFGPDHYNLDGPIQIRFIGPGKRSTAKSSPSILPQWIRLGP